MLGIAAKSGSVVSGEFSTEKAVKEGRAYLVIVAGDSSDNTKKMFSNMTDFYDHKDAIKPGQKVVIIDDLIATGGTVEAAAKLIEQLGGEVVKIVFLMELAGLEGRKKLEKYDVASVIRYEGK